MTPDEAAWVRTNAWRKHHRSTYREIPAFYTSCACLSGPCGACDRGDHHRCMSRDRAPIPSPAAYVTDRNGFVSNAANVCPDVWMVDRTCRWVCPCDCRTTESAPTQAAPGRPRRSSSPATAVQLDLFSTV